MQVVFRRVFTSSSVAGPELFWGAKYYDLSEQRYFIWTLPVKAQNAKIC